jgi:hypothetical protein
MVHPQQQVSLCPKTLPYSRLPYTRLHFMQAHQHKPSHTYAQGTPADENAPPYWRYAANDVRIVTRAKSQRLLTASVIWLTCGCHHAHRDPAERATIRAPNEWHSRLSQPSSTVRVVLMLLYWYVLRFVVTRAARNT